MFLRATTRNKDGKVHRYWSVVENRRVKGGRVVQRHVLYLGEINDSQRAAWCKSIEVLEEGAPCVRQMAIFPEPREAPELSCAVVHVKLDGIRLERPRQWGACWLGLTLWDWLELDEFWRARLGRTREGTDWLQVLKTLAMYRLIDPGSEWRLHRLWYQRSAMADLLGEDDALVAPNTLYRCLDKLLAHKQAFVHAPEAALGGLVPGQLRGVALRPDQHLLRMRRAREPASAVSATAATSAPTACRWSWP